MPKPTIRVSLSLLIDASPNVLLDNDSYRYPSGIGALDFKES